MLHSCIGVPKGNVRALGLDHEHSRCAVAHLLSTPPPDIIILDQTLDYTLTHGLCYYGTTIADELRASGFKGFICVCTADPPKTKRSDSIQMVIDKQGVPRTAAVITAGYLEWLATTAESIPTIEESPTVELTYALDEQEGLS